MEPILLKALSVSRTVKNYFETPGHDPNSYETLRAYCVQHLPSISSVELLDIMQFLQEIAPYAIKPKTPEWDVSTLDLEQEVSAIYRQTKDMLLDAGDDSKEALQMCLKSLESIIKLRERVYNIGQIQQLEEILTNLLEEVDADLRNKFIERLKCAT